MREKLETAGIFVAVLVGYILFFTTLIMIAERIGLEPILE